MKFTREQIFNYLADPYQPRCEPDYNGDIVYYLHLSEDGELAEAYDDEGITLTSVLCHESDLDGDLYSKESADDEDFQAMVDDFMGQLEKLDFDEI